jgi:hypothetical protein
VAARLARTLNLRLILAYATEDRPTFPYGDRPLKELQRRRAIEEGRELLEAASRGRWSQPAIEAKPPTIAP